MTVVDFVCNCRVFESTNAIVVFNYNKDKGKVAVKLENGSSET